MTPGRVLRISLPTAGSNSTHHTSPRCIRDVADQAIAPLGRRGLALAVSRHGAVVLVHCRVEHVRTGQVLQEPADLAARDDISVNQFIASAAAEKMASVLTLDYLKAGAAKAGRSDFEQYLSTVPYAPAQPGDERSEMPAPAPQPQAEPDLWARSAASARLLDIVCY